MELVVFFLGQELFYLLFFGIWLFGFLELVVFFHVLVLHEMHHHFGSFLLLGVFHYIMKFHFGLHFRLRTIYLLKICLLLLIFGMRLLIRLRGNICISNGIIRIRSWLSVVQFISCGNFYGRYGKFMFRWSSGVICGFYKTRAYPFYSWRNICCRSSFCNDTGICFQKN